MPKMFTKNIEVLNPEHASVNFKWKISKTILILFVLICIGAVALQAFSFGTGLVKKWDAIKFAYDKPAIVGAVKKDYESKQSKLDQSYVQPSAQSSEEKLIDEVVKRIQESK